MRYEQNLQAQLRERYRQLFKAGFVAYRQHTNYYRQFILKTPVLAAIVENIQRLEPDIDPDQWYRERQDRNMLYADGESKLAHAELPNGLKEAQILAHTRRVEYA
ncbi:MAG TPA: hypothetical protein VFV38_30905 [Ktedonobacteraceae bacterium]|nr:hypothetical protein [Ktedonobacteraceae bacterium]